MPFSRLGNLLLTDPYEPYLLVISTECTRSPNILRFTEAVLGAWDNTSHLQLLSRTLLSDYSKLCSCITSSEKPSLQSQSDLYPTPLCSYNTVHALNTYTVIFRSLISLVLRDYYHLQRGLTNNLLKIVFPRL